MLDVAHTLIVTTFFLKERAVSPAFTGDNRLSGEIFTHLKARRTNNINDPTQGTILNSARGRVDISAPGDQLTLAYYGGTTGGNQAPSEGGTPNGGNNFFSFNTAGTSFAAPTVAGGLSLMVDAGRTQLGGEIGRAHV